MASGYQSRRGGTRGFSTDDENNFDRSSSYDRPHSTNLNDMTIQLVDELKRSVQNKIQQGHIIQRPLLELEVANIKRRKDPNRFDVQSCKRFLPREMENCSDILIRTSIAYVNSPEQIPAVLKSKINDKESNGTSLDSVIGPLKELKREMDRKPLEDLFEAVRNINDRNSDRVDRLFFSEVTHFTPSLRDYTFDNAHNATTAIREVKGALYNSKNLLPILKVLGDVDEIRGYLKSLSQELSNTDDTTASRFPDRENRSNAYHAMNEPSRTNYNQKQPSQYQSSPSYNKEASPTSRPYGFRNSDDIPQNFNNISLESKKTDESPTSGSFDDNYPKNNERTRFPSGESQAFPYKSMPDPYKNTSQSPDRQPSSIDSRSRYRYNENPEYHDRQRK